jgi:hypothetical protein
MKPLPGTTFNRGLSQPIFIRGHSWPFARVIRVIRGPVLNYGSTAPQSTRLPGGLAARPARPLRRAVALLRGPLVASCFWKELVVCPNGISRRAPPAVRPSLPDKGVPPPLVLRPNPAPRLPTGGGEFFPSRPGFAGHIVCPGQVVTPLSPPAPSACRRAAPCTRVFPVLPAPARRNVPPS